MERRDGEKDKKKIEELKRQLAEEKRTSREAVARLHRELYRQRQTSPASNSATADVQARLLRELDRERMMRVGTQQRLQDVQIESDSCRARLHALQEEFRKMEEMVANMLQYKAKIDQLKQENASMKTSYESNLQKYCSHISSLERDNMMLRNQVKSMETQIHGKGDERDKSKLLLERLKMVEAENSSLVLENEQQRQQYEKCLDQIANQVVQALLAQKTLREECLKLQTRVQDLERQNKHLNVMFQQRLRAAAPPPPHGEAGGVMAAATPESIPGPATGAGGGDTPGGLRLDLLNTAGSLQSMCSEILGDDSPGKPQLSSPPPWLKGKGVPDADGGTSASTTSPSSTSSSSSSPSSTPSVPIPVVAASSSQTRQARPKEKDKGKGGNSDKVRIETEFPAAGNTSPKVKRVPVFERRTRSLERNATNRIAGWYSASPSAIVAAMAGGKGQKGSNRSRRGSETNDKSYFPPSRLKQSTSADAISHFGVGKKITPSQSEILNQVARWKNLSSSQDRLPPQTLLRSLSKDEGPAVFLAGKDFDHESFEVFNKNFEKLLAKNTSDDSEEPVWVPDSSANSRNVSSSSTGPLVPEAPPTSSSAMPSLSSSSLHSLLQASTKTTTSKQLSKSQHEQASKNLQGKAATSKTVATSTSKSKESSSSDSHKSGKPSAVQTSSSHAASKHSSSSLSSAVQVKTIPLSSSSRPSSTSSSTQVKLKEQQQQQNQHQRHEQSKSLGPSVSFSNDSFKRQHYRQPNQASSQPLRDPFAAEPSTSNKSPPTGHPYYYYYDYSDEDSDSRPISRDFSSASTMSLNEILDSSMEGEIALDDDFFSDWSSVRLSPGKRGGDRMTGVAISNKAIASGAKPRTESSSSSGRSRSTSSSPDASLPGALQASDSAARKLAAASALALREARLKQAVLAATKSSHGIPITSAHLSSTSFSNTPSLGHGGFVQPLNSSPSSTCMEQGTVRSPILSKTVSQQARTRILESTSSPRFPHSSAITKQVVAEVHSEGMTSENKDMYLPSASPSPNLSQRSQDQGYSSKESCSQSSPSPSPSMSHRGTVTPPWLHSTKDPHSFTRNELLTLVINREALGGQAVSIPSSGTSEVASPLDSPRLLRPGQLILAPQDKNFSFSHGFSSASSGSSDDKSPTKLFGASRHDMKSSVIEVMQDGSHVYPAVSSNSSTVTSSSCSSSVSSSATSSPIKSPTSSKIPPPVAKKPTRAVKPEARVAPTNAKPTDINSNNNNNNSYSAANRNAVKETAASGSGSQSGQKEPNSTDVTVGFLLQEQVFPPSLASKTDVVEDFLRQALEGHSKQDNLSINQISPGLLDHRSKQQSSLQTPPGSSNSSPYQTKCQSSDSSFENLRVERSGSKDDGYSTMSSDIHPEVLEKFDTPSSTLMRGITAPEVEGVFLDDEATTDDSSTGEGTLVLVKHGNKCGSYIASLGISDVLSQSKECKKARQPSLTICDRKEDGVLQVVTKCANAKKKLIYEVNMKSTMETIEKGSVQSDQSFDVTSDADSALETSVHSTDTTITVAETVSSSSCQSHVSSSTREPQLSVGSCKTQQSNNANNRSRKLSTGSVGVSRLTRIFDTKTKSSGNTGTPKKCNAKAMSLPANFKSDCKSPSNNLNTPSSKKPRPRVNIHATNVEPASTLPASSCQQPETPKRLANQFLKKAATGVSKTCKKITSASSISTASSRLPTKQTYPPRPTGNVAPLPKTPCKAEESKTPNLKKSVKTTPPNSSTGKRLPFGFYSGPKTESDKEKVSVQKKKNCTSPPVVQEETKKSSEATSIAKRGLKLFSPSNSKPSNEQAKLDTKVSTQAKDVGIKRAKSNKLSQDKTAKPSRPLSADYATPISNNSSIGKPSEHFPADQPLPRNKNCGRQRPLTVCSDRDLVKNCSLRIVLTNHAFQQSSSDDSDSDEKLATCSFLQANPSDFCSLYNNILHEKLNKSDTKEEGEASVASGTSNNSINCLGSSDSTSLFTTKSSYASSIQQSCLITANTSAKEGDKVNAPLPSAPSSMQPVAQQPPAFIPATKSSKEIWQQPSLQDLGFTDVSQSQSPSPVSSIDSINEILHRQTSRLVLRKSKSEHSLSAKPASTSAFDAFFGSVWDSGKVLERSASVSELDLLSKRSGSFGDIDHLDDNYEGWDQPSSPEFQMQDLISSWPSSQGHATTVPRGYTSDRVSHVQEHPYHTQRSGCEGGIIVCAQDRFQRDVSYRQYPNPPHHHHHHPHRQFSQRPGSRSFHHPHPLHLQPLRLDLSDVTELDEEGSERGDTASSFRGSLDMSRSCGRLTDEESSKVTSDESPRLDMDGQTTRFNSQFYSLCKVDSNRSLLSSVNDSRERLSLTSLNEISEGDQNAADPGIKTCKTSRGGVHHGCSEHMGSDSEIAAREFDEISRQIASLSRTVDELNQSLSSLTSSEFEPDVPSASGKRASCHENGESLVQNAASFASSLPRLTGAKNDIIDGYHWVNDEFFLLSGTGEVIAGGRTADNDDNDDDDDDNDGDDDHKVVDDGSLSKVFGSARDNSFEYSGTEDAREEFLHISALSSNSSVNPTCSPGGSLTEDNWTFSKANCTGGQDDIFARSIFDTVRENTSSPNVQRRANKKRKEEAAENGIHNSNSEGKVMSTAKTEGTLSEKKVSLPDCGMSSGEIGVDKEEKIRQDFSLKAADESVDSVGTSNLDSDDSLASDIGLDHMMCQRLFGQKGDDELLSSLQDGCQFFVPKMGCGMMVVQENRPEVKLEEGQGLAGASQAQLTETRDVGVDAMTQSQNSLSASFEYFDQSLSEPANGASSFGADVEVGTSAHTAGNLCDEVENRKSRDSHEYFSRECEKGDTPTNHSDPIGLSSVTALSNSSQNANALIAPDMESPRSLKEIESCTVESEKTRDGQGEGKSERNITEESLASYSEFVADLRSSSGNPQQETLQEGKVDAHFSGSEGKTDSDIINDSSGNIKARPGRNAESRHGYQQWRHAEARPAIPPRRPIITNGTLHASLERDVPPPSPHFVTARGSREESASHHAQLLQQFRFGSPVYFRQDRQSLFYRRMNSMPQHHHYGNTRSQRHVPYVNQPVPPLSLAQFCPTTEREALPSHIPRPLSDTFTHRSANVSLCPSEHLTYHSPQCDTQNPKDDSPSPPPLPPRQPHISRTLDGRPQVHIRPHRIHSDPRPSRPHSFDHYIIDKSKAMSSSSSSASSNFSTSPTSATLPARSKSQSVTRFNFPLHPHPLSNPKKDTPPSAGDASRAQSQRRRFKTRRERSQLKQGKTGSSVDLTSSRNTGTSSTLVLTSKSGHDPSSPYAKVKLSSNSTAPQHADDHCKTSTKSGPISQTVGIGDLAVGLSRRPWKDTVTSASVCVSGSESSCEDSSGSTH